jgi:hypothetical protein
MRFRVHVAATALLLAASVAYAIDGRWRQTTVTTGAAVQIGSSGGRVVVCVMNADAADSTDVLYCDHSASVTTSTGMPLRAGAAICEEETAIGSPASKALYCIAGGGSVLVGYKETVQ